MIPGADVLIGRIRDHLGPLFPEELPGISRAVEKRRREFAAGRNLARTALAGMGVAPCAIVQSDRSPVWPPGIAGSIAHTDEFVAVSVADRARYRGLGIDIETCGRVTDEIEAKILTPDEIGDVPIADARTLRFACKEAVYKAVHPLTGVFFGFHAVHIQLDGEKGTFNATPIENGPFAEYADRGRGVFVNWQGHHVAAFCVPR